MPYLNIYLLFHIWARCVFFNTPFIKKRAGVSAQLLKGALPITPIVRQSFIYCVRVWCGAFVVGGS